MLLRVTGKDFTAGIVIDEQTEKVTRTAPKLRWAMGLTKDQLKAALIRKGLKGTLVRTLTAAEMTRE